MFKSKYRQYQLQATKDFIEKCLTLDPAYRPSAAHLLQADYFSQDEFTKRKPLLQGLSPTKSPEKKVRFQKKLNGSINPTARSIIKLNEKRRVHQQLNYEVIMRQNFK